MLPARMKILKETLQAFLADDCPRMAAALSYYTIFSLPALLLLVLIAAGLFADPATLRAELLFQVQTLVGEAAAEQVGAVLEEVQRPGGRHPLIVIASIGAMLFAATGAFYQLQATLNRAWQVEPDPARGGVRTFLLKRIFSFAMILGVALLLLLSLLTQTLFTAFGGILDTLLPDRASALALRITGYTLSLAVATLLFGVTFQVLPDAVVHWRDAWRGAFATALLFLTGNLLLGLYFAHSEPGSAFGAAGSLALILAWIYYSSMIIFLGAELTQVLASQRGEPIRPSPGAVHMVIVRRSIHEEPGSERAT
jgi:membrane protein